MTTEKSKINQYDGPCPCPGLRAWTTCAYVPNPETLSESKIDKVCLGNFDCCGRYFMQVQTQAECVEEDIRWDKTWVDNHIEHASAQSPLACKDPEERAAFMQHM